MTNHREIVVGELNNGPRTIGDLAGKLFATGLDQQEAYRVAYVHIHALISEKKIVKHISGCYQLSPSTDIETFDDGTPKLRSGTSLPKKYSGMQIAQRLIPKIKGV